MCKIKCIGVAVKRFLLKNRHIAWAGILPLILLAFFLTERCGADADYFVSYTPLDDKIPFIPAFVLPYFLWFPSLFGTGLYLMFKAPDGFRRYMWFLGIGFLSAILFCAVFPNGQNLRPARFETGTVFTRLVAFIYSVDTNTNVLPSMHILGIMAVVSAFFDVPALRRPRFLAAILTDAVLIALSTVFIKQHSVLDIYAGLGFGAAVYVLVYVVIKRKQIK
jgi:membrane-associated phospholipid phosphatase